MKKYMSFFVVYLVFVFFPDLHFMWHMTEQLKQFIVLLLYALSNTFSYCLWLLCMKTVHYVTECMPNIEGHAR